MNDDWFMKLILISLLGWGSFAAGIFVMKSMDDVEINSMTSKINELENVIKKQKFQLSQYADFRHSTLYIDSVGTLRWANGDSAEADKSYWKK